MTAARSGPRRRTAPAWRARASPSVSLAKALSRCPSGAATAQLPTLPRPWLAPGAAIDELTQDVSVPGMPGGLLEQMHQHPAQPDRSVALVAPAGLVQIAVGDDGIGHRPRGPVARAERRHRVGWLHGV